MDGGHGGDSDDDDDSDSDDDDHDSDDDDDVDLPIYLSNYLYVSGRVVEADLTVDGTIYKTTAVSMGNPHSVRESCHHHHHHHHHCSDISCHPIIIYHFGRLYGHHHHNIALSMKITAVIRSFSLKASLQ